jgi:hypothetical protein
MKALVWMVLTCVLAGCAIADARIAHTAQQKLIGWSEVDLETCLGAPDQRSTFGDTDILTYYGNSTNSSGLSLGLPFMGGFGITGGGGGYCHATFRVKEGRVAEVRYSGETDATFAPEAYCAPIVNGCVNQPERADTSPSRTSQPTSQSATDIPH